ncbi:DsbE family thiol:disulfide interchange protein [Allosphingosinicella flava]|uniref:DsbE family thiol:disulfide interchange protein n=1 Tax=Allosphingosinicella flava TaxID=2771430 RepID=A0A7T2GKN6_9SPHN|nr:DsbE family thiol:disulfide interchange protein [Sphingosinicella flava]QPQ55619.1 DsbE family thiol:disulfide interchange protein [Sphingosinicella flava]
MKRLILWLPLAIFALFLTIVAFGLGRAPEATIQSQLIGKSVPDFTLPPALPGREGLASADLRQGKARVVNIFASWCVPCIAESPFLLEMKARGVPIDAIAIRDRPEDIARFLSRHGDPYERIGADRDSAVQLALGSAGVPETFVIDGQGIVRYQHVGGIGRDQMEALIRAWKDAQ